MLWFKHSNNQSEGETEACILTKFRLRGYGAHCLIQEVVTSAVDTEGCCEKTLPVRGWVRKTQMTRKTFLEFIAYAQTCPDYQVKFQRMSPGDEGVVELTDNNRATFFQLGSNDLVTVRLPKMLELLDESTRKRARHSGTRPERFASESEEKKKRKKERREEIPAAEECTQFKHPITPTAEVVDEARTELIRLEREGGSGPSAHMLRQVVEKYTLPRQGDTNPGSGLNGKER